MNITSFDLPLRALSLGALLLVPPCTCLQFDSPRSVESILPIYWLHIPKTGSSFATTLAHTTCGESIPADVVVKEPKRFFLDWEANCSKERFLRFAGKHPPLPQDPEVLRHAVIMQRRPQERILSGYFAFPEERLHDCPRLAKKYHCSRESGREGCDGDIQDGNRNITNPAVVPPTEYADCVANCSTNMLSGRPCGEVGPFQHYPAMNLTLAIHNVEHAGFVGLTEEWELSVCLWHARFGGVPLAAELMNTRPRGTRSAAFDERRLLGGWRAPNDEKVFEAAKGRFERELATYGVSLQSCKEQLDAVEASKTWRRGDAVYDED